MQRTARKDIGVSRPSRFNVTHAGRLYLVFCAAVGFAAVNTNNNLLYLVLCLMLALMVISGFLSGTAIRRIAVKRILPHRVYAEHSFQVELTLVNRNRFFPVMAVELRDRFSGTPYRRSCFFLRVATGESRSISYRCDILKRGRIAFTDVIATTGFPFGLFNQSRTFDLADFLIVWPNPDDGTTKYPARGGQDASEDAMTLGRGEEFFALRRFDSQDDPRHISWKLSARAGALIVKEHASARDYHVQLVLNTASEGEHRSRKRAHHQEIQVERLIGKTAYLVESFLSHGVGVDLVTPQTTGITAIAFSRPDSLLDHLALLSTDPADAIHVPRPTCSDAILLGIDVSTEST